MKDKDQILGWDCAGNPIKKTTKGWVHWDKWIPRHFFLGPRPKLADGSPDLDWDQAWFNSGRDILNFFFPDDD